MEKKFRKAQVYKIEPIQGGDIGDVYIGSTTSYLCKRLFIHKYNYIHNKKNYCIFKLFDKYGVNNFKITLIEIVESDIKRDLLDREGHFIKTTQCINKYIPRTREQYIEDNKDFIKERLKEYGRINKEKISIQKKEYYQANKDTIKNKAKIKYDLNKLREGILNE